MLRDLDGSSARPPGLVVAGFSVLLSAGIVFATVDWWPGKGRTVDDFTNLAVTVVLGVLLLAVDLVWAIKSIRFVADHRRWSWKIATAPIVVIVAAALGLLIPSPSFESSRSDFDLALRKILSSQESTLFDRHIGPYTISRIERRDNGAVYFYDSDQVFLTVSGGWVYSPEGPPPERSGIERFESTHIDGPWYEFTSVWAE